MSNTWTIKAALDWTTGDLERNGEANPRLAAQWLLSAATKLERIELYTNFDQPLTADERAKLRQAIERRRAGEPLQYILGKAPFRRLELKVCTGVLIPRPETEILVDIVLEFLAESLANSKSDAALPVNILDLCTGTGCIALSFLRELPGCCVTAIDIDPLAVALAQYNARQLNMSDPQALQILQDDLATQLLQDPNAHAAFDVVVSNPPYIPSAALASLPKEVADFEPSLALDGGADGLDIFRRILVQTQKLLRPSGLLAVELFEESLEQACAEASAAGFCNVQVHSDLTHRSRFITMQQKPVRLMC